MAKLSMINKNERRKALVVKYAGKYAVLKAIANDESRSDEERLMARLKMAELPRNANPTRVRNRCELTGRPRAYYRKFKLSRIMLRELANKGLIPGVTKSSWYRSLPQLKPHGAADTSNNDAINRILQIRKRWQWQFRQVCHIKFCAL